MTIMTPMTRSPAPSASSAPVPHSGFSPARLTPQPSAVVAAAIREQSPTDIERRWLRGKSPGTVRVYLRDLRQLADWVFENDRIGAADGPHRPGTPADVMTLMITAGKVATRRVLEDWAHHLQEQDQAPATINRTLNAAKSLLGAAEQCGLMDWTIRGLSVPAERRENREGPDKDDLVKLIRSVTKATDPQAVRDLALIRVLICTGMRRSELTSVRMEHVHLGKQPQLSIKAKGRRERVSVPLRGPAVESLEAWIAERGDAPGPLFLRLDRAATVTGVMTPMSGETVRRILIRRAKDAGIEQPVRPHGIRHSGATRLVKESNASMHRVRSWTRHQSLETVAYYLDRPGEEQAIAAELLAL